MFLKLAFLLSVTSFVMILLHGTEGLKCFNGTQVIEGKVTAVPITEVECTDKNISVCSFTYEEVDVAATMLIPAVKSKVVVRRCAMEEASNALNGTCKEGGGSLGGLAGAKIKMAFCVGDKCNTFAMYNNICKAELKEPSGESAVRSSISVVSALALGFVVVLGFGDKRIVQTSA